MKNSIIILIFFMIGLLLGFFDWIPLFFTENDLSLYVLYVLMFLVGIGIGSDYKAFKVIEELKFKILLVPLSVIIGSLFGAAFVSLILPKISISDAMAVGGGFGYYSLSSIFITQVRGEALGVIALLSNISREIICLLATPLLLKYFGKLAGISAAGATSMDTCLPIIAEYTGKEWAIVAVFSGIVLTIVVPILIPLLLILPF